MALESRLGMVFALGLAAVCGIAAPITFKIGAGRASQQIAQVESVSDFETFTARTAKVSGSILFDPEKRTGSGKIVVDVVSLDTGIEARNGHLQNPSWLDAAKYPEITFEATQVRHVRGDDYRVMGKFTLHGVTKAITVPVKVKHIKEGDATRKAGFRGDVLQVKASFSVKLADYGVMIPPVAQGKVGETVAVSVTTYGQSGA